MIKTWEDLYKEYPIYRDSMKIDDERNFVNQCFILYENDGFAKVFWSQGGDYKQYYEKPFIVIGRLTEKDADLECLPMWKIKFEDGEEIHAYPDEIIPREMRENGCKLTNIE